MTVKLDSLAGPQPKAEQVVQGCCFLCPNNSCGSHIHVVDGKVTKILPKMNPHNLGKMCAKGMSAHISLYSPYRITSPLIRRNSRKGIGLDPEWDVIKWEEALNTAAERLKDLRRTDPRRFAFFSFKTAHMTYYAAFTSAFGSPNFRPFSASLFCGNNVHTMCYMVHGTFHDAPDLDYCKLLITFGTQYSSVGGIDTMYSAKKVPEARRRGMKFIVVDPIQSAAAARADQWIPIRPGTDMVLALGMVNLLLNEYNMFDSQFLKMRSNAPYLVTESENYIRDEATGKPLVWDSHEGRPKPYDGQVKDYALTGSYDVRGIECRPGFELVRDRVKKWTPEEVEKITTVPAQVVTRLARQWGETASIGSTVTIDGSILPYRPVALHWYRGISAHKNSTLSGFALSLLKLTVGAVDVPGGSLGEPYEEGYAMEGPDGLLTTSPHAHGIPPPYPPRRSRGPETLWSFELFPTAAVSETMLAISYLYPERYPIPYKIDTLFNHHTNIAKTSFNPDQMAGILSDIPFQVSFNFELDETAEFADLVIPALHNLETLTPFGNVNNLHPGMHEKYFLTSFPAARPPFESPYDGATDVMDYLIDIANRADFLDDLHSVLNIILRLKGENMLNSGERYSWSEIADRYLKSRFGEEYSLQWFREHGFITQPRKISEAYPGAFDKPRVPFYFEFMATAREDLKRTIADLGYTQWDFSPYKTVPDWHPCPSHTVSDPEYDLFLINRKSSFLNQSQTGNNPMLEKFAMENRAYDLVVHESAARRKGISDGDTVYVESFEGIREKGKVRVSQTIHPETVVSTGIAGFWAKGTPVAQGKGFDFNKFLFVSPEKLDFGNGAFDSCVKVKMWRAEE